MSKMGTALTIVGVVLILLGGWFAFLGTGGWKILGSQYQDQTSIAAPVSEVLIANPGLAQVEIRPAAGTNVEFRRTVRWQPPFTNRPGQTHRVEGTRLFLDQADGLSAVDYLLYLPTGVHVSR